MTDRMDTEAPRSGLFLIVKRDLYYRPNDCGYTGIKDHAGRYTLEEVAVRFPNMDSPHQDGTSFIAEEDAPEFTKACFWDLKLDHVTKQRDDARAEALELRAKLAEIAPAMAVMHSEGKAAFDDLDLMRSRLHAMHRRAQRAETEWAAEKVLADRLHDWSMGREVGALKAYRKARGVL